MIPYKEKYNIGIVGSTGAVGEVVLELLEQRNFPVAELRLFASDRSLGIEQRYRNKIFNPQSLNLDCFEGLDFCIFTAGGEISRQYVPLCVDANCIAIDNTSAFRMHEEVPLVVPEVNAADLELAKESLIVANPNCSTIQMVMVLAPIQAQFGLKRVIVSTYQSVSGAGKKAIHELSDQVMSLFNQRDLHREVLPHQIAFNCIPQIDKLEESGYSKEELKVVNETRKILHAPELKVTATTVRVPTFSCHCESVYIETEREASVGEIRALLGKAPGVTVLDEPDRELYPLPYEVSGRDEVFVGRIRKDLSEPTGLNLWIVADNLRKGAALNAIQIAETLIDRQLEPRQAVAAVL